MAEEQAGQEVTHPTQAMLMIRIDICGTQMLRQPMIQPPGVHILECGQDL